MFTWIEKLVASVPEGWDPGLSPKNAGDTVLEVPAELVKTYVAGMWAIEQGITIAEAHELEHDKAEREFRELDRSACEQARSESHSFEHRGKLLQSMVREEIRERLGLGPRVRLYLTMDGMASLAPEPERENPLRAFLSGIGSGGMLVAALSEPGRKRKPKGKGFES